MRRLLTKTGQVVQALNRMLDSNKATTYMQRWYGWQCRILDHLRKRKVLDAPCATVHLPS